jgi:DNA ligase (NAD+)
MPALRAASVDEIAGIFEIGDVIAQSVHAFLQSDFGRETIDDLTNLGVNTTSTSPPKQQVAGITGKTFVVTGTLSKFTRDEIQAMITQAGGRAASSVSKSTDFLVAGEKAGSKLEKATALGIPVLTEEQFEALLAQESPATP